MTVTLVVSSRPAPPPKRPPPKRPPLKEVIVRVGPEFRVYYV